MESGLLRCGYGKSKASQSAFLPAVCKSYGLSNNYADGIKCAGWKFSKSK